MFSIIHVSRMARRRSTVALAAGIILLVTATVTRSDSDQEGTMRSIEGLSSKEPRIRDQVVDSVLHDRLATVQKLISLIDPTNAAKYSDETRCSAAFLLGELRAVEAVPVLSQSLISEPGRKQRFRISRYDAPVWNALVKIGRPAVPTMIKNIETTDNRILRVKSLDILVHILGGKKRLLELLDKLEKRAGDKEVRQRITDCIAYSRDHYKESEEPLY